MPLLRSGELYDGDCEEDSNDEDGGQEDAGKKDLCKSASMPASGRNPKGGLTAAGRAFYAKTEGANLKPGVKGAADTPEKMKRKGSFLRRHFANPRGPMVDEQGKPTRLALSAQAWGEPLPKTMAAAKKLAAKGEKLLEQFHASQKKTPKKSAAKKTPAKRVARRTSAAK